MAVLDSSTVSFENAKTPIVVSISWIPIVPISRTCIVSIIVPRTTTKVLPPQKHFKTVGVTMSHRKLEIA